MAFKRGSGKRATFYPMGTFLSKAANNVTVVGLRYHFVVGRSPVQDSMTSMSLGRLLIYDMSYTVPTGLRHSSSVMISCAQ